MVESIKEYQQVNGVCILKVFLKPTKKFPNGYFYTPSEAIDLVQKYTWCLHQHRNRVQVVAHTGSDYCRKIILFHKELFRFYQGYDWQEDIDHINLIEFDNTDGNLNAILHQQNLYNTFVRGYIYGNNQGTFRPKVVINSKHYRPYSVVYREDEACILQNRLEQVDLKSLSGTHYYMFDILKYRRGYEDILDLERTGKISEEEATREVVRSFEDNAWFYLRYNLAEYFKDNHIAVPEYRLDAEGFMVHPITNQKLCPF